MPDYSIAGEVKALVIFVDIIDSSKYSCVLSYEEYAQQLLGFQELFESLGQHYFPKPTDSAVNFTQVQARGDEGVIFCIDTSVEPGQLMFKALEFIFDLKGRLRLVVQDDDAGRSRPKQPDLAAGVHFGLVAPLVTLIEGRSVISRIEGFSINYAKRVESCSRNGRFSHVFLSADAAHFLDGEPVILSRTRVPMKGIEEDALVYEVRSGFFQNIPAKGHAASVERLIDRACELAEDPSQIKEPWAKCLIVSILEKMRTEGLNESVRARYAKCLSRLAWDSPAENDPILLMSRARDYCEQKEYTQQINYLQRVLEEHPDFVHARKQLAKACWAIAGSKCERAEKVYARDVAKEFVEHFADYLLADEKTEFEAIIKKAEG